MTFLELHQQDTPLLIGNVWDASSANIVSRLGFSAVGTSSAAIAYTLGYEDGENMPFNELLFMVERISRVVCVPLTVDLEAGYGETADDIAANILQLAKLGVVGINLEDSKVINGKRTLLDADDFSLTLSRIRSALNHANIDMFINARADALIMKTDDALAQTLDRATRYEAAGANGLFVPYLRAEQDITAVVAHTALPVNVLCVPELPDFATLASCGVKRISMGDFAYEKLQRELHASLKTVLDDGAFSSLFMPT
ncbi:isocitrate lyase/PEP mutase family protein [Enterovibrio norvegicus]|uniref:isocitrate lyase/PEP mutase family protein n=1 Tax=Enterovibrio norvegicus TaxID=188144 RepID=UPI000C849038|nr:isocitrate lyase/phosphoenolpyruvate mutase family protein [Enterovibrio norvegicus]PMH65880.1 carboxyvinyl-carboxyphosphonate phosphorylmutase [Enterovibrio norvegicus]